MKGKISKGILELEEHVLCPNVLSFDLIKIQSEIIIIVMALGIDEVISLIDEKADALTEGLHRSFKKLETTPYYQGFHQIVIQVTLIAFSNLKYALW